MGQVEIVGAVAEDEFPSRAEEVAPDVVLVDFGLLGCAPLRPRWVTTLTQRALPSRSRTSWTISLFVRKPAFPASSVKTAPLRTSWQ